MLHIPDELDLELRFGSMQLTNEANGKKGGVILLYGEYYMPDEEGEEALKKEEVSTETDSIVDTFASSYALAFIKENLGGVYDRVIDREGPDEDDNGYLRSCYYIFADNRLGFSSDQMWEICAFFINKIPMAEIDVKYAEEYLNKKKIFWGEEKEEKEKFDKKKKNLYLLPYLSNAWLFPKGSVVYKTKDGAFVCETSAVMDDFFHTYKGKKESFQTLVEDTSVLTENNMEDR